jgi:hypothetical protein
MLMTIYLAAIVSMKRHSLMVILVALFAVGVISANAKASSTIATFDDPSRNSSDPLFKTDFTQMKLTGGWADTKTGLTLDIPYSGHSFSNAWFEMTGTSSPGVEITDTFGDTGGGVINFYRDGTTTNPLLTISFGSGFVSRYGFGADGIFDVGNVTIMGSEITGTLSEEQFAFSFANLAKLPGYNSWNDGYTTTAAFTSSAEIPEPATLCLLGLGALNMICRKRGY